jgi:DNA-binding transcriptional MerR regulator
MATDADPEQERLARTFVEEHRDGEDADVYSIGELAEALGTTLRAIRFYEAKGLLAPKRAGATRVYGRRERARLQLILRGKAVGLSLREIKEYLDLYGEKGSGRRQQLELVIAESGRRIDDLRARQEKIAEMLRELEVIREGSVRALAKLSRR